MRALVFGVAPEPWEPPDEVPAASALTNSPVALQTIDDATPLRPDWVVTRPVLAGVCGTDTKQVLGQFDDGDADSAMSGFCSFPQVLGHEVVAEVVELGPEADGVAVGDRVVLDPWLTCVTRGVAPVCPACEAGDHSLCWSFTSGDLAPGLHTGVSADATGGFADLMPAHPTMLHRVPDDVPDEQAVLSDPFSVSLHAVTRNPPPPDGRVLVWGAGSLGLTAIGGLRRLFPDLTIGVVARFDAQADLAADFGADEVFGLAGQAEMLERIARWSGATVKPTMEGLDGLPMCHPATIDVVYDTIGTPETLEVAARVVRARGRIVQSGVSTPGRWEWSPLYFKEIDLVGANAFGVEEVDGVRRHAIDHYLAMAADGLDLSPMVTHRFSLDDWRGAFVALADQSRSGAVKVTIAPD